MAFTQTFKSLDEVLEKFNVRFERGLFKIKTSHRPSKALRDDLAFTFQNVSYNATEASICENIIYPILKDAYKHYADSLSLWSHRPINFNNELSGVPDYLVAKRSERGMIFFEHPTVAVVEAKRDDFIGGWAQCSFEMYAIQKINGSPEIPVFGIVSNGDFWEFARMEKDLFTQFSNQQSLDNLPKLYAALCSVFDECVKNLPA